MKLVSPWTTVYKLTYIAFLDIAKAFDSVSHKLLLYKLSHYNIGDSLLGWFGSYLSNRSQRCIVEGATSTSLPVTSGVPQGSILGPLLFLVFVNDLPAVVDSPITLFADDSKCRKVICKVSDCYELQNDLDCLQGWSEAWHLRFNSSKCEVLTVTRKRNPISYDYMIDCQSLVLATSQKDLGVTITKDLKWNTHINITVAKAYKMLGFLRRHTYKSFDNDTRRLLYLTFVRSQLGYASELWAPQCIGGLKKIESLQRRATKYILNQHWTNNIGYRERLITSKLLPLSYWHEIKDLVFYFKCRQGHYSIPIEYYVKPSNNIRSTRNNSTTNVLVPTCRTKLFQTSYFSRITKLWNYLPSEIRSSNSPNQFKSLLFKRYCTALLSAFDIDSVYTWKTICPKCCVPRDISLISSPCCY